MILKNTEKADGKVTLEIQVEKDEFQQAVEEAYKKNSGRYSVPGFRRGRAPRKTIERAYGAGVFYEDAINIIYPTIYADAVKQSGIKPVENADVQLSELGEDGFTIKATVTVMPEVKLGQYKGLEAVMDKVEITSEDIDREVERRRKQNARLETKDTEAANGDTVIIDFEGFIDGTAFEGGKGENHSLKLGSGQFIPGFEDQLVGKKAEEECDVVVTFPEEYQAKELAGKEATFKCKVHEVKEEILPELDDEFAKDVSEFETLEAYKADLGEKLKTAREKNANEMFEGRVLDKLLEGMEAAVPDCMIEQQLDRIAEDFEYRLRAQGMTLDSYLKMSGMDMDSFRKTFRDQAERQVRTTLALDAVAEAEGIAVSEEELAEEYKKMAEQYKMEVDELKKRITDDMVQDDMRKAKAVEVVKGSAVKLDPKDEAAPEELKTEEKAEDKAE